MTQGVDFYQRVLARAVDKKNLKKLRFLSTEFFILLGPPLPVGHSKILHFQILLKMKICLRNPEFSWNPLIVLS